MRILIIERSEEIIQRLEQLVTDTSHEAVVDYAVSYSEALACVRKPAIDIILIDIKLAKTSSFELLKTIKKVNDKAVIVILFHILDEYIVRQCKAHGVDYMFDKYDEFEKIPSLVSQLNMSRIKNDPAKKQGLYKLCNQERS